MANLYSLLDMASAMKQFYVYIMASLSGVLYTGVTNNIERRVYEHKHKLVPGFTSKYNVERLVYCEDHRTARDAIAREKSIKGFLRVKKNTLVESMNPGWLDLSEGWYDDARQEG
jgi:putative endonuclease